jgi:GMP synthase (glutamine-hydrolysing)
VIQPDLSSPLSEFDGWLAQSGITTRIIRPYLGDPIPAVLDCVGLIVLGGDMSSLDDGDYPWLEDVRGLMRHASDEAIPTLGICLGAQLMAQAFGGETQVGDSGLEAGVVPIAWQPEANSDPIFRDLAEPFLAAEFHRDMISELPEGAVLLGTAAPYRHQAFRVGALAWGVQFHPEIACDRYQEWADMLAPDAEASDRTRMIEGGFEFSKLEAEVLRGTRLIARRFAAIVDAAATNTLATLM